MKLYLPLPLLAGTLVLLAACGSSGSTTGSPSGPTSGPGAGSVTGKVTGPDRPQVTGHTFVSTRVTVDGTEHALVSGSRITVAFTADQISIQAGCNSMGGRIRIDGSRIRLTDGLTSTLMGCSPGLGAQDQWIGGLFTAGVEISWEGELLMLTRAGTTISLLDQRAVVPDAPLVTTR